MAYIMNDEEKAERSKQKAIHQKLRAPLRGGPGGSRYDILAWAYVRGFKFRRCERSHHQQIVNGKPYEHNMPNPAFIWAKLVLAGAFPADGIVPTIADLWGYSRHWNGTAQHTDAGQAIVAWLADPSGAIAAPPPRPKKVHAINTFTFPVAAE
jgi:hypothetical protein